MRSFFKYLFFLIPTLIQAALVSNAVTLDGAISGFTTPIDFDNTLTVGIDLNGLTLLSRVPQLYPVNSNSNFTPANNAITINGNGKKLFNSNTANPRRGFFVRGGSTTTVTIKNLNFEDTQAINPSISIIINGGGGVGFGGALFVDEDTTVILEDVTFTNCKAQGGAGGASFGMGGGAYLGGGGGFMSSGGADPINLTAGGGGGLFGDGGIGANLGTSGGGGGGAGYSSTSNDGVGGGDFTAAGGGLIDTAGGPGGGGGGGSAGFSGGLALPGQPGGIGGGASGGGASNTTAENGGNALDFGGGGGGGLSTSGASTPPSNGGNGGFAGGGGGAGVTATPGTTGNGGNGGFGGGGGAGISAVGLGGFGGGDGASVTSGGGAGFGGAIFIRKEGDLTIKTTTDFIGPLFLGNTVTGGLSLTNAGLALGKDIFMMSGSQLTFDLAVGITVPNAIEGNQGRIDFTTSNDGTTLSKGLTKTGDGKLSLTGDNTYTGTTTVQQGELNINGSVVTDVVVESGGTLSGNLEIKENFQTTNAGDLTNNGGLVSPGNGNVGEIRIAGDFTQSATGTLEVDITPTANNSDKIFIETDKQANIDGFLQINIGPGNYIDGTLYTVIDGPVPVESVTVVKTGPLKDLVNIQVFSGSLNILITNTVLFACSDVAAGNPQMMIAAIENLTLLPNTPLAQIVEALGVLPCPSPQLDSALNKMTAANYANSEWISLSTDTQISSILAQHIHSLKCAKKGQCGTCKNAGFWLAGLGNFEDTNAFDWLSGYEANTGGALMGMDFCTKHFHFGMGGGYTYTDFDLKDDSGFGDIHSGFGALYGSFLTHYFIADASVIVGGKHVEMNRKVAFLMINDVAHSTFDSPFVNTHLGFMMQGKMHDFRLEVFGNGDYHYSYRGAILETGTPINLFITKHHSHFLKAELGTNLKGIFNRDGICYAPFVGFSVIKKFPLGKTNYNAHFVGNAFCQNTVTSSTIQELASPRCGLRIHTRSFNFMIGYKGEFNKYTKDHQIDGRFEWTF